MRRGSSSRPADAPREVESSPATLPGVFPLHPITRFSSLTPCYFFRTNLSIEEFLALRKSFPGEFLWARRGGKRFLIRDRAVLAEARALFDPLRTLDPEREALQARQRDLAREEAVLDREQQEIERAEEALENDHGDNARATREDLRRRQDDLRPRMRRLESKDWELEAIERSLEEREEALEKKAEEKLWQLIDATVARGLAEHLDRP